MKRIRLHPRWRFVAVLYDQPLGHWLLEPLYDQVATHRGRIGRALGLPAACALPPRSPTEAESRGGGGAEPFVLGIAESAGCVPAALESPNRSLADPYNRTGPILAANRPCEAASGAPIVLNSRSRTATPGRIWSQFLHKDPAANDLATGALAPAHPEPPGRGTAGDPESSSPPVGRRRARASQRGVAARGARPR